MFRRHAPLLLALLCAGCGLKSCGRGGRPPERPPIVKGPDGKRYQLLDRGPYKAYYDTGGHLQRIEYDSNNDGRADQVAHHAGAPAASLLEVDADFDGRFDRWEYYDPSGTLLKVGSSRHEGKPDVWVVQDEAGKAVRNEYDEDGDGRPDRVEILEDGRVAKVEVDADRDGRMDRWQDWKNGRLITEDLDTNGDGVADRRLRYGEKGNVLGVEPLKPGAAPPQ